MRKSSLFKAGLIAVGLAFASFAATAGEMPYNLLEGKPFAGTKLKYSPVWSHRNLMD